MKYGLPPSVVQKITAVLTRYPQVESATLYGSRAKGTYNNGSDIDLTLHGGDDLTLNVVFRILEHFDDLLLPYTIDLSSSTILAILMSLRPFSAWGFPFTKKIQPLLDRSR